MPSTEPPIDREAQQQLLALARRCIQQALDQPSSVSLEPDQLPAPLNAPGACFVTLHKHGQLRGCIGSLVPRRSLAEDVAANAQHAAFADPRFPPVSADEVAELHIEIAVLSPEEPIPCASEAVLLTQLQPYQDGLTLRQGDKMGTFLPTVWEQLPDKQAFLDHLKDKAGIRQWDDGVEAFRYHSFSFAEEE